MFKIRLILMAALRGTEKSGVAWCHSLRRFYNYLEWWDKSHLYLDSFKIDSALYEGKIASLKENNNIFSFTSELWKKIDQIAPYVTMEAMAESNVPG